MECLNLFAFGGDQFDHKITDDDAGDGHASKDNDGWRSLTGQDSGLAIRQIVIVRVDKQVWMIFARHLWVEAIGWIVGIDLGARRAWFDTTAVAQHIIAILTFGWQKSLAQVVTFARRVRTRGLQHGAFTFASQVFDAEALFSLPIKRCA